MTMFLFQSQMDIFRKYHIEKSLIRCTHFTRLMIRRKKSHMLNIWLIYYVDDIRMRLKHSHFFVLSEKDKHLFLFDCIEFQSFCLEILSSFIVYWIIDNVLLSFDQETTTRWAASSAAKTYCCTAPNNSFKTYGAV